MWGEHNSLCVRSVERRVSSIEKNFFQLKVSLIEVVVPPEEFGSDDVWVEARSKEHIINVFERSHSTNSVTWYYLDMDADDTETGTPGVPRSICGSNVGQMEAAYLVSKKIDLFTACESGLIIPGYLLSGVIAKLNVEPYKIGNRTVTRFTMPVLWDEAYPADERKLEMVKAAFAKEGKVISLLQKQSRSNNHASEDDDFHSSSNYDEHGGPSDGYGGHLSDDFINDALGGEADAYWNLD